jgi:hypothetical protein
MSATERGHTRRCDSLDLCQKQISTGDLIQCNILQLRMGTTYFEHSVRNRKMTVTAKYKEKLLGTLLHLCCKSHRSKLLFYYYYYLVCEAIGTAVTPGLLRQPRVIVKMIVEKQLECRLAGETNRSSRIKPVQAPPLLSITKSHMT